MRTITLELLRHGPAHNQLLSPLTSYLALCENHSAVTMHVPFEHNQFLHRLDALGYRVSDEARIFQFVRLPLLKRNRKGLDWFVDHLTHDCGDS